MTAFVYEIRHRESGKRYVGITTRSLAQRWGVHRHEALKRNSQVYLHRAMRMHGVDAFDYVGLAAVADAETAKRVEKILIRDSRPEYNLTAGGDGKFGCVWTAQSRAKASASAKRKPPITDETRARMAEAQRKSVAQAENRARMTAKVRGVPLTPAHRAKISAAHLARSERNRKGKP